LTFAGKSLIGGVVMNNEDQIVENLEEVIPPSEDKSNMTSFVGHCVSACWAAYAEIGDLINADYHRMADKHERIDMDKYGARQEVKSWLYDAASILTIIIHDGKLLSLLSEWYERDGGIPWSKKGDWRKTNEC
jgi:hypothetical protein